MGALYRRQGKYQAAETLEDAALRAKKQVIFKKKINLRKKEGIEKVKQNLTSEGEKYYQLNSYHKTIYDYDY